MAPQRGSCRRRSGQCPPSRGTYESGVYAAGNIHAWNVRPRLYLETVSELQPLPVKYRSWIGTTHPMVLPVPTLVGITDTNALASRVCNAARNLVAENLFTGLPVTRRSNTYVSAHVPEELARHLADVAKGHPGRDLGKPNGSCGTTSCRWCRWSTWR